MSTTPKVTKESLEDFALKGMHLARMTGVMIASHAIPDSFLLMHSGVGCKYKTASQGSQHDYVQHPNEREAWTQVSEHHLVKGCAERIGPFARAWWERRHSHLMVVVSAYFIELTGDDVRNEVTRVEQTLPECDMVYVDTATPQSGFFDGYASVMREIVQRMDWSRPSVSPKQAAVLGFFFHRHENDVKADVGQLKALVKSAGLEPGAMLFSGQSYLDLKKAPEAGTILVLPYVRPHADAILAPITGRRIVHLDLPMGISGTSRFLREVAAASGMPGAVIEKQIEAQASGVRNAIAPFTERLRDVSVAVFADTPLAAGVVTILLELGVRVRAVGLRDTKASLGGRAEFLATLARNGLELEPSCELLDEPSFARVGELLRDLHLTGEINAVVASSHEHSVVLHDPDLAPTLYVFETGFPQDRRHCVLQQPSLGFHGVAQWAQRILDRSWEHGPL